MSCKTETKIIGEHEYSVTQWPAEKAMLVKFKLLKMFGSSLALLVDNGDGDVDFSGVLSKLFETTTPEDMVQIIKSSVIGVARDGTRITDSGFTEIFSGDLVSMYSVLVFVIKTNYADFFSGQLGAGIMTKMKDSL